ncbi:hypothetical protein C8Q80DRAFT_954232, partial [Daedaleopsis nitida]
MPDMDSTYGALFIGVLVSAVLFGVTMLQAFVYFSQYPSDHAWRKLAVCWLCFLDGLHLALSAHFVYHYLVVNYDNPSALSHMIWSFKLRTVVDGFVVVSVHTLYTNRLWTLLAIDHHVAPFGKEDRRLSMHKSSVPGCASRWLMRRVVPWFVSALVAIGYGVTIVMCYETFRLDSFTRLSQAPWATYIPYCFSTVIDTIIAGSLCYFLARCRPESGAMNGPMKTLMVYTLNTGIISSVCSLVAIAMMVAFPKTFIPVAIEFLVIKLYINSYLAMVNARGGARNEPDRRIHSLYTPNTSIALRDVVELETKPVPYPLYHHPDASLHADHSNDHSLPGARKSLNILPPHDVDIVLDLSRPPNEAYTFHAPRMCHPDLRPDYSVVETAVPAPARLSSLAERLAITPPPPPSPAHSVSRSPTCDRSGISPPTSAARTLPLPMSLSQSRSRSSPRLAPPSPLSLSPSRTSPHPLPPASPRRAQPLLQDFPLPPERTLSPLRFGSPPPAGASSGAASPASSIFPASSASSAFPASPVSYAFRSFPASPASSAFPTSPASSAFPASPTSAMSQTSASTGTSRRTRDPDARPIVYREREGAPRDKFT